MTALIVLLMTHATGHAGTSQLWGENGELWDSRGRLPDFSYAGYHAGEKALPQPEIVANVNDFGAVGDGVTDDTAAFQSALDAVNGGALWIPAGTYRLTDVLTIRRSNVVLRGTGEETILDFQVSLTDVRGEAPQWSWNGGLIWIEPEARGEFIADVAGEATRGDTTLIFPQPASLASGQLVELRLTDDDARSLGRHIHHDQVDAGDCSYQVPLTLHWPAHVVSLDAESAQLSQPLRFDVRPEWQPEIWSAPFIEEVGIEELVIRFPDVPYAGHLSEPGYNGVWMSNGVVHSWVRNVVIENSDNGILIDRHTKWITAQGLVLRGRDGHHGANIAFSADGLYTEWTFEADFVHALTLDHRSNGNVFSRMAATPDLILELDHHRDGSFENLFTSFEAPTSFLHGGNFCAGYPSGARGTFWNLPGPLFPPYWGFIQLNSVGDLTVEDDLTEHEQWHENVSDLQPRNLHLAQRARRLGEAYLDTGLPIDSEPEPPKEPTGCACSSGTIR